MNVNADVQEIIEYLESNDLEIVNYFKNTVQEKLYASRDHNLLGAITDRYIQTKSDRLLELLISINDTHAMYLFDKLNDHLKHGQLTEVCTLLFSIVRKQPSWLHKIVNTSLFATFLKFLKNESDIVFIMSGIIILCTLIPCIPAIIRSYHGDILEVFVRTAGFILNKSGQIPEVCILHLHIGVYILFHRLYAMYPNNFLSYMKSCFAGSQKKDPVFQLVIKPMFEFVKFHPDLITETPKSETGLEKWKVFQPHDVLADCQKISLDPVDSVKEANYAVYSHQVAQETSYRPLKDSGLYLGLSSIFTQPETDLYITPIKRNTVDNTVDPKPLISDNAALCNPSDVCGLTTPPCSRQLSPSNSTQDLSSLYKQNHTDVHLRDSISNLNELPSNRKSSSDTASVHSNTSPGLKRTDIKKTQSFGSSDNVNHKNLLKSWLPNSASHSTPVEKELLRARQSAPASPKRGSINKGQQNRPKSTEYFKHKIVKQLNLGGSGQFHSAPTSPMVHTTPANDMNQFSFNLTPESEVNTKLSDETTDSKVGVSTNINNAQVKDKPSTNSSNLAQSDPNKITVSIELLQSIRNMFSELCPKPLNVNESHEMTESKLASTCPAYKLKSPLTLLDDFIQYGSDIHSFQMSRIPLTSQLETDWTYFGGATPVDELKILQTQVHMLHIQLLYERHKCELHCLRNRRLFGSLQKSQALQHEVKALKDHCTLTANTLADLRNNIRLKYDENRLIRQQAVFREQECLKKIKQLEQVNTELEFKLKTKNDKKKELKKRNEKYQKEVNKLKYQLFEATQEILTSLPKLSEMGQLQAVVETLQKELLTQSEKQEHVQARVDDFEMKNYRHLELENKLTAHRYELEALHEERDVTNTQMELLKVKINELEGTSVKKDKLIREHKIDMKNIRAKHKDEMKALEERFKSCQKTCQGLQSYITSLYAKLEDSSSSKQSSSQHQHSTHIPWNSHNCGDKCHKSVSYVDFHHIGSSSSHHDQSHRHALRPIHAYESTPKDIHSKHDSALNPFTRSRSQASSVSSVSDSLKISHSSTADTQDSGIERSNDVIARKNGALPTENNI